MLFGKKKIKFIWRHFFKSSRFFFATFYAYLLKHTHNSLLKNLQNLTEWHNDNKNVESDKQNYSFIYGTSTKTARKTQLQVKNLTIMSRFIRVHIRTSDNECQMNIHNSARISANVYSGESNRPFASKCRSTEETLGTYEKCHCCQLKWQTQCISITFEPPGLFFVFFLIRTGHTYSCFDQFDLFNIIVSTRHTSLCLSIPLDIIYIMYRSICNRIRNRLSFLCWFSFSVCGHFFSWCWWWWEISCFLFCFICVCACMQLSICHFWNMHGLMYLKRFRHADQHLPIKTSKTLAWMCQRGDKNTPR